MIEFVKNENTLRQVSELHLESYDQHLPFEFCSPKQGLNRFSTFCFLSSGTLLERDEIKLINHPFPQGIQSFECHAVDRNNFEVAGILGGKFADNPSDKGGFSSSRRTGYKHAGLSFIVMHGGVIDEGFDEVEDGIAFRLATSNRYVCIVAGRAKQSTNTSVKG